MIKFEKTGDTMEVHLTGKQAVIADEILKLYSAGYITETLAEELADRLDESLDEMEMMEGESND